MSLLKLRDRAPRDLLPLGDDERLLDPLERLVGRTRAERLLRAVGQGGIRRMPLTELVAVTGLSFDVAERVVAARDLADLLRSLDDPMLGAAEQVVAHLPLGFRTSEIERLIAFALDGQNRSNGAVLLAQGGASHLSVTTTDIFRPLVRLGACSFVLAHNHPSGDCCPSKEDVVLTNRVARVARILGMTLVDHLVVTTDAHLSFYESGLMPTADELADPSI